jgi:hypothetical protein
MEPSPATEPDDVTCRRAAVDESRFGGAGLEAGSEEVGAAVLFFLGDDEK